MAKIYETNDDLERERISREASDARESKAIGSGLLGISIPLLLWGFLRRPGAEVSQPPNGFWKQVWEKLKRGPSNLTLGTISMAVGAAELWGAGKKQETPK